MKLLRVIATLDPRHGGPAAGLRAITPALAALGHESHFASLDAPEEARRFADIGVVHALGPARGGYAYSPKLEPWLRQHAGEYDAVFVHGIWQFHGRAVHRVLRRRSPPYFVFPHGMLDPWFNRAYPLKHLKKWIYWRLCEYRVLADAAAVLFTCEEERRLARTAFSPYRCRESVVAYGTAAPHFDAALSPTRPAPQESFATAAARHTPAGDGATAARRGSGADTAPDLPPEVAGLHGRPYWLFLGRIHPKKGVDLLLRAYAQIASERAGELPALVIAGPSGDPGYQATLVRLADKIPPNGRVLWPGMLQGARKWHTLGAAEAFVLPSHQENFGIAVVEALAMGTPVLISKQVNIWDAIVAANAGYAAGDSLAGTIELLRRWCDTRPDAREVMGRRAVELFRDRYEISRVAHSLIATITPLVASRAASA